MKPTTLEESLSMVPTHWPLSSRRDKWQKGDQYFAHNLPVDDSDDNWVDVGPYHIESIEVVMPDELGRRAIPQDVRESAAWWLLYNTLTTVGPQRVGFCYGVTIGGNLSVSYSGADIKSFESENLAHQYIESLGGEQRIIKELSSGPDPLGRWILAGKP